MFLDISKEFDKAWHQVVFGNFLKTLTDFLKYQRQRVILNEQNFSWTSFDAGLF